MFRVTLSKAVSNGVWSEVGSIEFQGVAVENVDGSVSSPLDKQRRRVPFSYRCAPPHVLSEDNIRHIAESLSRRAARGSIDGYEWRVG
jgi:hypothetical protein